MSEPETNQIIQLPLQAGQQAVVTRAGVAAHFNAAGQLQVTHNGQTITVYDKKSGLLLPAHIANDKPIDGAPAVLWHRTNGRLTKDDIAKTICDDKDNPIGIYTGVWTPKWAKGQEIRTYAAITDARDEDGVRIYRTFNQRVAYLNQHPNGEKLLDRPSHARDVTYEMAMRATNLNLKPGEFTKQMIPPLVLVRGKEYPSEKITHPNNMYDLRHKGDFAKADNNGVDSRFVTKIGSGYAHWYVSSTEARGTRALVSGTDFTDGYVDWGRKVGNDWSLRPFVAELPQP